ncbi:alkaline phosphatase PhoX [Glycomyces sp. NPDC046736]|uniref:alkaline phosphatase PhoX n=1 Tax=Glycomyces sp. NPDC046736 TaxID=3155615 RepID=UPI0033F32619
MATLTTGGSNRRSFLRRGPSGVDRFAIAAMEGLAARAAAARDGERDRVRSGGYGALREVVRSDAVSGREQTMWLPEGFDFAVFSAAGSAMRDGGSVPASHGGMACFPTGRRGEWRLVRGHGERGRPGAGSPSGSPEGRYDALGAGGTTTLGIVWRDGEPHFEEAWQSLSGVVGSGAGGPTPWGSWLAAEATCAGTGAGWGAAHGYVFEVPSAEDGEAEALPLKSMGRFAHGDVAVDPRSGTVYLAEDQPTAGCYRFVPEVPGDLAEGGRLQMLKVAGEWNVDTRVNQRPERGVYVEWVDVAEPDPAAAEDDPLAVFNQGWARGAAVFGRLTGCFYADGAVYLAAVSGGDEGEGQLWEYRPRGHGGGTLKLVFESPDASLLSFPQGMAVSPGGSLILCEDTGRGLPALRGMTREGEVFAFAKVAGGDLGGAVFSPDGKVLFANLWGADDPGRTVAIWGPWSAGAL